MKTLILALALVAKADAPKAELHEVAAASAAVASVQIMPEAFAVRPAKSAPCGLNRAAVGIAAVAPERIVPEAGRGRIAVADAPLLDEALSSVAAKSGECLVSEVGTGEPCALRASVSLKTVTAAPVAEPRRLAPLPEPKSYPRRYGAEPSDPCVDRRFVTFRHLGRDLIALALCDLLAVGRREEVGDRSGDCRQHGGNRDLHH